MNENILVEFEGLVLANPRLTGEGADRMLSLEVSNKADETLGVKITKINGFSAGGYGVELFPAGTEHCAINSVLFIYRQGEDKSSVELEFTMYRECVNEDYDRQLQKHRDEEDYPMPTKTVFRPSQSKSVKLKL